jgi:hypothetical protein
MIVATRTSDDIVTLEYRGLTIQFRWYSEYLFVATDKNGDIWAYSREPDILEFTCTWDPNDIFSSTEVPIHYLYEEVEGWEESLVEYEIKEIVD